MSFFYYERTPTGRWSPVMSDSPPASVRADGVKVKTSPAMELTGDTAHLTFGECRERWPVGWWESAPESRSDRAVKRGPRSGEKIGAGFFVFRRGDSTNRIRPSQLPFEHPSKEAALAEAVRLAGVRPGYSFDVFERVSSIRKEAAE